MSEELRYDQGQIELTTEDGFLRAKVFLTRPGVYPYLLSNGEISYEAKLEEDLFSDVVLDTAKGAPVVEDHPLGKIVTATNFKELVKGTISNPRREGKFLVADEVIYDSDLISKLKQGVKREVSVGWKCDLVSQSGEINGRRYDKVQKN